MIFIVCSLMFLVMAVTAGSTIAAARADHLMAFSWSDGSVFFFARRARSRRYDRIPAWRVPGVALGFAFGRAWARMAARTPRPAPALAAAPVRQPPARFARLA